MSTFLFIRTIFRGGVSQTSKALFCFYKDNSTFSSSFYTVSNFGVLNLANIQLSSLGVFDPVWGLHHPHPHSPPHSLQLTNDTANEDQGSPFYILTFFIITGFMDFWHFVMEPKEVI